MYDLTDYYLSLTAGLISFFSPCILPLFPVYLTTLNNSIESKEQSKIALLARSLMFVFSFCFIFVLLGLTATSIGIFLNINKASLLKISGTLIMVLGLLNLFSFKFENLNKNFNVITSSSVKPIMLGLCFGLAWTPCVGPILASIVSYSSVEGNFKHSSIMLLFYSIGLGIPFIIGSLGMKKILMTFKNNTFFLKYYSPLMGIILILFGYLVFKNKIYILTIYIQKTLNFID